MAWIRACGGGSPAVPDGRTVIPTDDVTIWQKCAGIANPTYTTLAGILADSGILSTLIDDNNAVDYMVRSTTWATTVCSNSTAMQYIGANNYAADTLLANSDWCTAIRNSTYFASVLNVKVPTMTSNTTPSGTVSAKSYYAQDQNYPWKAFDGNNATMWASDDPNADNQTWIGYEFTSACCVKAFDFMARNLTAKYTPSKIVSQYYSNNEWVDGQEVIPNQTVGYTNLQKFILSSNTEKTTKWRLLFKIIGKYTDAYTIQFYGRKDV